MAKEHEVVLPPHLDLNISLAPSVAPDSALTLELLYKAKATLDKNTCIEVEEFVIDA